MLYPIELRARAGIRTMLPKGCQETRSPTVTDTGNKLDLQPADSRGISCRMREATSAVETPSVDTTWLAAA